MIGKANPVFHPGVFIFLKNNHLDIYKFILCTVNKMLMLRKQRFCKVPKTVIIFFIFSKNYKINVVI